MPNTSSGSAAPFILNGNVLGGIVTDANGAYKGILSDYAGTAATGTFATKLDAILNGETVVSAFNGLKQYVDFSNSSQIAQGVTGSIQVANGSQGLSADGSFLIFGHDVLNSAVAGVAGKVGITSAMSASSLNTGAVNLLSGSGGIKAQGIKVHSASFGDVGGAAQVTISRLGKISTLEDIVIGNSKTIGCTADADLITLANNSVVIGAGDDFEISKAGGLNLADGPVTSTAAELNLVDGSSAGTVVNNKAVIYSGAGLVQATTVTATGVITGGSLNDGTATYDAGVISSGVSATFSGLVTAGSFNDGAATYDAGVITSAVALSGTDVVVSKEEVNTAVVSASHGLYGSFLRLRGNDANGAGDDYLLNIRGGLLTVTAV
jgi:hypothetical protein